jgi:peptide-methionine (S)-S-oxide reductase
VKTVELLLCFVLFLSIIRGEETMKELEKATFGAGCFWCVEAVFQRLDGVKDVVPGYCGGDKVNPTYKEVCTGRTGHAEVAQITFDPATIAFDELLNMFWQSHDPTTRNRQGNDVGTQYRSAVFYHNEEQRSAAEESKENLDNSEIFSNQIVTEITALDQFWPAEDYHNNYYNNNPNQPYCRIVIKPKLDKLFKKK